MIHIYSYVSVLPKTLPCLRMQIACRRNRRRRDSTCQEMTGRNQPGSQERNCNYTVSRVLAPPYIKLENSGPLGLFGFAVTTFVLGLYSFGVKALIKEYSDSLFS
ncbi:hypothetical protein C8Q69DRAFT_470040 [Paecilomyces variotii]|uniref:Uncharacterized protein n=1 Tax=Byssochlamys spectabilis TaxID=264951 RepID=A0A443HRD7_BYSSP|nr:hypothetical protein C8Q69DRAFT_470040 [Paecilomyces variotii]RWQ94386.1 hypothetical protein C8Q69DRAFT_470040 [Paecilomyces variotii]